MTHDVFISHSSKDKTIADAVCAILEKEEIPCWIARRDIDSGRYAKSIVNAIDNSELFVVILSENSDSSKHVANEVIRAFNQGKIIIPFCIKNFELGPELSYFLEGEDWVIAIKKPCRDHILKLAVKIKNVLKSTEEKSPEKPLEKPRTDKNYEELPSLKLTETCPECKSKNPEGFIFCVKCGYHSEDPKEGKLLKILKGNKIPIFIGLIIIAILIGVFLVTGPDLNSIRITDPINGSTVPFTYTVKGTLPQNLGTDNFYLLIQPQPLNGDGPFEWWPYEPTVNSDGTWECSVQIGVPNGDVGRSFKICIINTDEKLQVGQVGYSLPKNNGKYEIMVKRQ